MTSKAKGNIPRRIKINIATIILLAICLCITTFALVASTVVQRNIFETGNIDIQVIDENGKINDEARLIEERDFLFEPGMTVVKPVYVKNTGTWDAYCKLYFKDIKGDLADILDVTVADKITGDVLYTGKVSGLNSTSKALGVTEIKEKEKREYTVTFHYPEAEGNAGQGKELTFTMEAKAIQTKNNPDVNKDF